MAVSHNGDPLRLVFGYDVKGDTCGSTNDPLDLEAFKNWTSNTGEDLKAKK